MRLKLRSFFFFSVLFLASGYALTAEQFLMQREILFPNLTLSQKQRIPETEKMKGLKVRVTWLDGEIVRDYVNTQAKKMGLTSKEKKLLAEEYAFRQHMDIAYVFLVEIQNSTTLFSTLQFLDPEKSIYLVADGKRPLYPWFMDEALKAPFTDTMKGRIFFKKNDEENTKIFGQKRVRLVMDGLIPEGVGGIQSLQPDFQFIFQTSDAFWKGLHHFRLGEHAEDWTNKGLRLYKEGHLRPSIFFFNKAYQAEPTLLHGLLLAEAWLDVDLKKAYEQLVELKSRFPDEASVSYHFGLFYEKKGSCPQAIQQFQKALAQDPKNLEIMRSLAHCLEKEKQREEARKWYEKILEFSPQDEEAQKKLGGW